MTVRGLLLSLLTGALVVVLGRVFLSLPAETQTRWRPALLVVCAVTIVISIAIMVISLLGEVARHA